jgi:hypothetical protein
VPIRLMCLAVASALSCVIMCMRAECCHGRGASGQHHQQLLDHNLGVVSPPTSCKQAVTAVYALGDQPNVCRHVRTLRSRIVILDHRGQQLSQQSVSSCSAVDPHAG